MTSFKCTNPVFKKIIENDTFSKSTPSCWTSEEGEECFNRLNLMLKGRSFSDIALHVEEIRKRSHQTKIGDKEYRLFDLDNCKNEILKELRNKEYKCLEDTV